MLCISCLVCTVIPLCYTVKVIHFIVASAFLLSVEFKAEIFRCACLLLGMLECPKMTVTSHDFEDEGGSSLKFLNLITECN